MSFFKKLILLSPIFKYQISGTSMAPTIAAGETVLVNRMSYVFWRPEVNDIVALHDPRDRKVLIKRIIKIDKRRYFVQGDNKKASTDSRVFGMIERRDLIGKVVIDR